MLGSEKVIISLAYKWQNTDPECGFSHKYSLNTALDWIGGLQWCPKTIKTVHLIVQSHDAHLHHRSLFWIWRCWGPAVCGRARSPRAGSRGWTVLRLQRTKTAKEFKPQKRKSLMRRCWGETGALVTMQGPPLTVFWKKRKKKKKHGQETCRLWTAVFHTRRRILNS